MLNYGGSITSAFPNTFCNSPNSLTCQLCNKNLNQNYSNTVQSSSNTSFLSFNQSSKTRLDKCIHCGINICEKCFNENQENLSFNNHFKSTELIDDQFLKINNNGQSIPQTPESHVHYSSVKKDFKNMYNYSKEIVEKLHFLNNAIKVEESAVGQLNLIKHQVNTKAIELVKQVNQEKLELVEQIENVKRKYESTLNERKEYYALSVQYKDELRKVIRRYKDSKIEEQCSLNDLLKMYMSVKTISKSLDDYDHIKLITEEEPLQVEFDERPVYRNIIGKLLLNNHHANDFFNLEACKLAKKVANCTNSSNETSDKYPTSVPIENKPILNHAPPKPIRQNESTSMPLNTRMNCSHRSVSLNDLVDAENDSDDKPGLINNSATLTKKFTATPSLVKKKSYMPKNQTTFSNNCAKKVSKSINNLLIINEKISPEEQFSTNHNQPQPFYLPNRQICEKQTSPLSNRRQKSISPKSNPSQMPSKTFHTLGGINSKKSILKNNDNNHIQKLPVTSISANDQLFKRMELYKSKTSPKERLEVDICPSHLDYSNNKLLVASVSGKIRVVDLVTYKIQKDELKNLFINGIRKPKNTDSNTFYAVTNGEMKSRDDTLNVSSSVIIVTKSELKVLKKNLSSDNDNYLFSNPCGICYDQNDNLYICDSNFNRIKILDKNFQLVKMIESASSAEDKLSKPSSIVYFKNSLYVCDSGNYRIVCYSLSNPTDLKFKSTFGVGFGNNPDMLKYPLELCIDNLGILSAKEHRNSRVQIFSPETMAFHTIEINTVKETIFSMAVSDNGDIYVGKMLNVPEFDQSFGKYLNKYYIDIY